MHKKQKRSYMFVNTFVILTIFIFYGILYFVNENTHCVNLMGFRREVYKKCP